MAATRSGSTSLAPAASLSILPVARRRARVDRAARPEAVGRRRVGALRAHALHRAPPLRPDVPYWFRVEWEGLEKIPHHGGALLIANHAGAIPSDAPAIMHGIEEELGRPVYGLADYFFRTLPVVGTMWSRTGGVPAHPDNAYRLLHDQQQLALVFPEGTKATSKTYTDRYRLRRFGRGGFVEIAMRAGVPIIPIAVVGRRGVDAHPVPGPQRGQGCSTSPTSRSPPTRCCWAPSATSPTSRPSSSCGSSTRSPSTSSRARSATRGAGSWTRPRRIRARLQDALHDMLRERRSVWFG